jgi:hypothetical protein
MEKERNSEKSKFLKKYAMEKFPKKKTVSVNFPGALFSILDFLALEYGTARLSQNVDKKLPVYTE